MSTQEICKTNTSEEEPIKKFHKHWHNMDYSIERDCIRYAIENLLRKHKSAKIINKLQQISKKIEEELFYDAENYEDYTNILTLRQRMQQISFSCICKIE